MKIRLLVVVLIFSGLLIIGCGTSTQVPFSTETPEKILPTQPVPTNTIEPSPTAVPEYYGNIAGENVNVRGGPGTNYSVVISLQKETRLQVIGRNEECSWLVVRLPDGQEGWIRADLLVYSFACSLIEMHAIPPAPTAKPYVEPTFAGCEGDTVDVTIINDTGGAVSLTLRGPCTYTFYLGGGNTSITILPGSYSYSAYGCGGASINGTRDLGGSDEWTWYCE